MITKNLLRASACGLVLVLAGCSDEPAAVEKKGAEESAGPVSGMTALWKMYQVARSWSPDAQVLRMNSMRLAEVPDAPGKAGAWQATFVSDSKASARPYTFSVVEGPSDLHKGVFAGQMAAWTGPSGATAPFLFPAVKVDTDAAYQSALKSGGAEYSKTHNGSPVSYLLEKNDKYRDPSWRVIWGESVSTSDFSIFVDATNGNFLERMH